MNWRGQIARLWIILLMGVLSACAGKSELQHPAQNFYNAASALAIAEPKLLNDVNDTAATLKLAEAENKYIEGKPFDLPSESPLIPAASINVRVDATKAIQLYAQSILALTGSTPDQNVDTYSEALAKNLQTGAGARWSGLPAQQAQALSAALSGVLRMVIDQKAYTNIVKAAKAAQPHLEALAALIAADAESLGDPIQGMMITDATARVQLLETIRQDKRVPVDRQYELFATIVNANQPGVTLDELQNVSSLAQSIVAANAKLAAGDISSFNALAEDAYRRGLDAYTVFQQSKK